MAVYSFSKTPVNIDRLTLEILSSTISGANYQYANYTSPNLSIYFDAELSSGDVATLSGIMAAHAGQPVFIDEGLVAVADGAGSINFVSTLDPETVTTSGLVYMHYNLDGGRADSVYGGISTIDGGDASSTY